MPAALPSGAQAVSYTATQPSMLQALSQVVQREGVRSLWKGNAVTILHRLPYSSINFLTYEQTKQYLSVHAPKQSDFARRLSAGATAGLVACTVVSSSELICSKEGT